MRIAVKKRTLWLGVGFIFLSLWAVSTIRGGIWLVLFACFVGLEVGSVHLEKRRTVSG